MKNTVTVTSTGLLKNNSDFGEKTITVEVKDDKDTITATKEIKVFYPAKASNSKSKASGTSDPNWFTYYKQAAGGGSYQYDGSRTRSYSTGSGGESTIRIAPSAFGVDYRSSYILTSIINGKLKMIGVSANIYYYKSFVGVLAHEREHANNHLEIIGSSGDSDGDGLLDSYEISTTKTDPNIPDSATKGTGFNSILDAEIYAGGPIEEKAYLNASSDTDWASPGGQW